MNNERIDVLAVMDGIETAYPALNPIDAAELRQARAAVAELIEADKEYDAAAEAYKAMHIGTLHAEFVEARDRMRDAALRRDAALTRVQGGA